MPCVKGVQVYNCVTVHSGLRCPHFMQIKLRTGFGVQECVQCANCANFDRKLLHLWVITRELHKRLKRRLFTPRGYESTHGGEGGGEFRGIYLFSKNHICSTIVSKETIALDIAPNMVAARIKNNKNQPHAKNRRDWNEETQTTTSQGGSRAEKKTQWGRGA